MGKTCLKKSAGIVFTDGKSILLLLRAEGKNADSWGLPGGKCEEGETEIENATRETREETGLQDIPGQQFDSISHSEGNKAYTAFFYQVEKPFEVKLNHEHKDSAWVKFENLKSLKLHPKLKANISDYLRKIRKKMAHFSEWSVLKDLEAYFD
jgi:mutator protein MutT